MRRHPRCPICKNRAEARANDPYAPFCSERCKLVDLGNWLSEGYRIPESEGEEDGMDESVHRANEGPRR